MRERCMGKGASMGKENVRTDLGLVSILLCFAQRTTAPFTSPGLFHRR